MTADLRRFHALEPLRPLRRGRTTRLPHDEAGRNDERRKRIIDVLAEGVVILDTDGVIVECNRSAERILGVSGRKLIGRPGLDAGWRALRDDGSPFPCARYPSVLTLTTGRACHNIVMGLVRPLAPTLWLSINSQPLFGSGTDPEGVVLSFFDISERKRSEQYTRFQAKLLDMVGEAVIATDVTGNVIYWNRFAETLYGCAADDALGQSLDTLIAVSEGPTSLELIERAVREGMWSGELEARRRDGSPLPLNLTLTALRDAEGMTGVVGLAIDNTERKKIEDDRIRVQRLESIGVLAGGIAHDFNNILTAVLGNIDLARLYSGKNKQVTEVLDEAERAFWRARGLTQQLLTFAKGGAPIRRVRSIEEVMRDAAHLAVTGSTTRCECELPRDLWAAEFDAGQIGQVMSNLIINAKQAMPAGGTVRVGAANVVLDKGAVGDLPAGRYIKVTVADHGIGIPREHLSKIFDPYFTTKKKGTGLGLATSYSIVRKHDGHIDVDSKVGRGTRVDVYLPAVSVDAPATAKAAVRVRRGSGKVLLMDDEAAVRTVGGRLLEALGYEPILARDGEEAIRLYVEAMWTAQPFAAVILDVTVSAGMGGRDCMKKLKLLDPDVKGIVCSGYSNDRIMADYVRYHFRGVVAKPYQLNELSEALQGVLAQD